MGKQHINAELVILLILDIKYSCILIIHTYIHTWYYMGEFCLFQTCEIGNSSKQSWPSNKETMKASGND